MDPIHRRPLAVARGRLPAFVGASKPAPQKGPLVTRSSGPLQAERAARNDVCAVAHTTSAGILSGAHRRASVDARSRRAPARAGVGARTRASALGRLNRLTAQTPTTFLNLRGRRLSAKPASIPWRLPRRFYQKMEGVARAITQSSRFLEYSSELKVWPVSRVIQEPNRHSDSAIRSRRESRQIPGFPCD